MATGQRKVGQDKSGIVAEIPLACTDEALAVEFMERQRWGDSPKCVHCESTNVYRMVDAKTGERSRRFLWRCRDCKRQGTVRLGTVFEESRIPLRHWVYCFWRANTSKKGVAALEIKRQTGLSYRSSLFLLHRVRMAMTELDTPKLTGVVESDETWIGGVAHGKGRAHIENKVAVQALVQRGGPLRARTIGRVTVRNLRNALTELVDESATLHTDDLKSYKVIGRQFKAHRTVNHTAHEYEHDGVHVNTCEGFFSLLKRSLHGIHHAVSRRHLHRYVAHMEFLYNGRDLEDGERTVKAIRGAVGKRLFYRQPVARSA